MNYIYDIYLNFDQRLYDFYEWNSNDAICHIRKIPVFKVTTEALKEMISYHIEFQDLDFLTNATEIFIKKGTKKISNTFIVTDGLEIIGIQVKGDGTILFSKMLFDEEEDVYDLLPKLNQHSFSYQIKERRMLQPFQTKKEREKMEYSLRNLSLTSKDSSKIQYLYYECFNKKESSSSKRIQSLKEEIMKKGKSLDTIYDFFKLTSVK